MNYYLAREGQTYGPYPEETFPSMLQQGQVVPQDLVCPEGGSDWVELNTLPTLTGAKAPAPGGVAMPTPVASNKLKISGQSGVSSTAHMASPVAAAMATPAHSYPAATYPKAGLMEKAAGAFGALKILGYAAAILFVVGSVIFGYVVSQREKKEIAKLESQPGWKAFSAGNSQIDSESSIEGFGNNGEAQVLAKALATATETFQRMSFELEKTPRFRGRSKLGRVASAVDAASAGKGHFQTYIDLRDDRALVLVHVPEFSRYKSDARESMTELCWHTANLVISEALKSKEAKPAPAKQLASARPAARPTGGRTPRTGAQPGKPPALEAQPVQVEPTKPAKERTLVLGVRGKSDYECVFLGKITADEDAPTPVPIKKNVPSHKLLVKWFAPDKPSEE